MALAVGTRIGPYEILAPLGAGGMGEVYRATDTHLARQVAIKVLPDAVAADAERLARFDREAKTLAALNHPNIAAIYGLERSDGTNALVMELVEGPTLADAIAEGSIPIGEVLPIARQIAEALEAAHEQGIIHRDLKPANIKLRPDGAVKVLDFGLAKALEPAGAATSSRVSLSPTITSPAAMTNHGVILGTAAYMSPEQARGKPADRRADIWAFGVVLYEMLTGTRAFGGDEITDTLAFIITKEPDWNALPANTPAAVRRLLRRCLEKDRKRRLADIADARLEIEEAMSGRAESPAAPIAAQPPVAVTKTATARYAWLAASVLLVTSLALTGVVVRLLRPAGPAPVARFTVSPPADTAFHLPGRGVGASFAFNAGTISPDGRALAFTLVDAAGRLLLWLRPVDSLMAQPLAGTDGAAQPFWSPDSRSIAFYADGKLKKVDSAGGPALTLCDAAGAPRGGTWNRDGVIVFSSGNSPLLRVPAAGGQPSPATTVNEGQAAHRRPYFLPDGRHFLYRVIGKGAGIVVGSLNSTDSTPLVSADSQALYSPPGYLLFVRQGTLMGQPFDAERLQLTGDAFPIAEGVATDAANGLAAFSVSENGVLTFRTGETIGGDGGAAPMRLDWVDRQGKAIEPSAAVDAYRGLDISPDGARVAFHRHDDTGGDVWLLDVKRAVRTRLTFNPAQDNGSPVWSFDGSRIVFSSRRNGSWGLYQKPFDSGGAADELLVETRVGTSPTDTAPDGTLLVYTLMDPKDAGDIWLLPLTGDRKPAPFAQGPFNEGGGRVSPDGRWIAYQSSETGRLEVYVRPFPSGPGKRTISTTAAVQPRWRHDGKELFYLDPTRRRSVTEQQQYGVMAVDVNGAGTVFEAGVPKLLFTTQMMPGAGAGNDGIPFAMYGVSSDGQRFLITRPPTTPAAASPAPEAITVVLNWIEAFKK